MSKIAKKPIQFPAEVTVVRAGNSINITGPLGQLSLVLPAELVLTIDKNEMSLVRIEETKKVKSLHGTYARLLANNIKGVTVGFTKVLEVVGTGFKAEVLQNDLVLSLGYSHQIKFPIPQDIKITVTENKINVTGISCELVGLTADKIKFFRKPDSYKGKGIRYLGQQLKLKPGKAAAKGVK